MKKQNSQKQSPVTLSPDSDAWIPFATVGKPHGLKGAFFLKADDRRTELDEYQHLMIEARGVRTVYPVEKTYLSAGTPVVQLQGISSRDDIALLANARVFVHRSEAAEELTNEEEYLVHDLKGMKVRAGERGIIGEVVAVASFGAQDNLEIQLTGHSHTVFFPFLDAFVTNVDTDQRIVDIVYVAEFLEGDAQ